MKRAQIVAEVHKKFMLHIADTIPFEPETRSKDKDYSYAYPDLELSGKQELMFQEAVDRALKEGSADGITFGEEQGIHPRLRGRKGQASGDEPEAPSDG